MITATRHLIVLLAVTVAAGQATAQTARQFPDTQSTISVFGDQLPGGLTSQQLDFVATHYVGTQKIPRTQIDAIRTRNAAFMHLHYRLGCEDGPAAILIGNTWTNVKWLTQVNPRNDWFWLNSGSRIHHGTWDWYMMDVRQFGADTWTSYWLTNVVDEMRQNGADGVFADTFDPLIGGFDTPLPPEMQYPGAITGLYPQLNVWQQTILDHFTSTTEHFLFVPNYGALVTGWNNVLSHALCDGCMVEGFGDWGTPPLAGEFSDWQLQMNRCLGIVRAGKGLIAQHYLASADATDERMFVLGMYLLIKGDHTFVNLLASGDLEWYPEYGIDLGMHTTPLATNVDEYAHPAWGGLYRRHFQKGTVVVNPTGSTVNLPSLGGTYWRVVPSGGGDVPAGGTAPGTLSYVAITSLSLASNRGAVLLFNDPNASGIGEWKYYE